MNRLIAPKLDVPPTPGAHLPYGYGVTAKACRAWLLRDSPECRVLLGDSLTEADWEDLALALANHCDGTVHRPGSLAMEWVHAGQSVPPALKPWFYKSMSLLTTVTAGEDNLIEPEIIPRAVGVDFRLTGATVMNALFSAYRFCSHFDEVTLDRFDALADDIGCKALSRTVPVIRRMVSVRESLAGIFGQLPLSTIKMFETARAAQHLLCQPDHQAHFNAFAFVWAFGYLLDDNRAKLDPECAAWWDRFMGRSPANFGYSVDLSLTPFHSPAHIQSYALYLRNATRCFDPTVDSNVSIITRYQQMSAIPHRTFDISTVHRILARRAAEFTTIEKALDIQDSVPADVRSLVVPELMVA